MKKFLFVLILLLALAGTIFFLGWAQLTVPPGSYGVMRSKTHGLENEVIRDGEFRWFWYKAIPTNAKVSVFNIGPVKRSVRSSGNLSSGMVYAALAGLDADFSWEISAEISFNLKPEYLPELTERENINDSGGMKGIEENLASRVENLLLQRLKSYAESEDGAKLESLVFASSLPEMAAEIQAAIPGIENLTCTIQALRLPDYTLYRSIRALYQEYMSRQSAILSQDVTREAERRINVRIRLEELGQYGELLTKYPILLDYLAIEKGLQNGDLNNEQ